MLVHVLASGFDGASMYASKKGHFFDGSFMERS
jgi:hypothetical protein